jgi:hypothetical protein
MPKKPTHSGVPSVQLWRQTLTVPVVSWASGNVMFTLAVTQHPVVASASIGEDLSLARRRELSGERRDGGRHGTVVRGFLVSSPGQ